MKKIFFVAFLLSVNIAVFAQCGKDQKLTSSKTEYLDSGMNVQKTVDENTVIEITKDSITIIPGSDDNKMTGTIASTDCNWTTPYKEGKSVLKTAITDPGGDTKNVTITIAGKEGKLYLTALVDDEPNQIIRVALDSFEEKK